MGFCESNNENRLQFSGIMIQLRIQNFMEVLPMAYKITSACVSCGTCADACPAGAISQGDRQADCRDFQFYHIHTQLLGGRAVAIRHLEEHEQLAYGLFAHRKGCLLYTSGH